jgi:hypothetical protein
MRALPWCRVIVTPSGSAQPTLDHLSDRLREIGIEGVRPISPDDKAVCDQAESVERLLANLKAAPEELSVEGASTAGVLLHLGRPQRHGGPGNPEVPRGLLSLTCLQVAQPEGRSSR